jgi:hypothetical protein
LVPFVLLVRETPEKSATDTREGFRFWSSRGAETGVGLLAQAEFLDERRVPLSVGLGDVTEQAISLAHHEEEPAATRVILSVRLEVVLKRVDPLREDCDLDFR